MRGAVWVSIGLAATLAAGACGTKEAVNEDGDAGASDGGDWNAGAGGVRGGSAGTSAGGSSAGEDGSSASGGSSTTGGDGGSNNTGGATSGGGTTNGGATSGGSTSGGSNGGGTGGSGGDPSGGGGGTPSGGTDNGTGGAAGSGGGTNLVTNGDFSNGDTNWNHDGATASHMVTDGVWCGSFLITSARVVAGWPDDSSQALSLSGEYTFSFKMSLTGNATILAKIGRAVSPYTTDFQIMVTPGETLTSFSYTVPINDPQAGVAFDITGNSPPTYVCIDDVVISPR